MSGSSNIQGEESILFTDNMSFDGTERGGAMNADGQLWIGSGTGRHVRLGTLTQGSGITITNGPGTITIAAPGSTTDYHDSIYIVGQNLLNGANYTDLATAYAAAVAAGVGATIMLQPGVYTLASPLQIRSGINLFAQNSQIGSGPVAIKGKLYDNGVAASCAFNGITFITNSDYSLSLTASSVTTFYNCWFRGTNNTIFNLSAGTLKLISCQTNLETTGISVYNNTGGTIFFQYCILGNDGSSTTTGTHSSGSATFRYCTITTPLATSGTGYVSVKYSQFGTIVTPYINQTWLTTSGTVISYLLDCSLYSGTATAVSIGAGTTVEMYNCIINSSNASAISGAGSIKYGNLDFTGTSSVNSVTTQTTTVDSNDALNVVSPGAYPYTASAQDAYISVNTSSAKTVNLPSSPVSGQKHIIADITGLAFTNNITVSGNGKTIDGSASYTINFNYGCVKFIYNGTEWNASSASNARDYHDSIYIVGSNASANYTTIASAYAAAAAATLASGTPSTVFIQPGTYTEDLTLSANVNLCAHVCDAYTPNVIIKGKVTAAYSGTASISGVQFLTNSDYCIVHSGANTGTLRLINCYIYAFNNTAINITNSSGNSTLELYNCKQESASNNIFFTKNGFSKLDIYGGSFNRDNSSTGVCTSAGTGSVQLYQIEYFRNSLTTSDTSTLAIAGCHLLGTITSNSTTAAGINNCVLNSGTATAVSVGSGGSVTISNSTVASSNANVFDGAGTIKFSNVTFSSTSANINTTTQVPLVASNDAIKVTTPGAYPYTTIPQDAIILVDTSSARTIIPLASPTTGQKHIIKDSVGSAASNNITITPSGKNIDGAASSTININYGSVTIVYNGSGWSIC